MQKLALLANEQPDYSPVCGMMSEKLTSKFSQHLGFTARDGIARSRAEHTFGDEASARQPAGALNLRAPAPRAARVTGIAPAAPVRSRPQPDRAFPPAGHRA